MKKNMKALTLTADWAPRNSYQVNRTELNSRKAISANTIWKNPELKLIETPVPTIEEDEVLLKVKACGICGSDTHCYEKDEQGYVLFSGPLSAPVVLGHEFSGEVVKIGKKADNLKVGDAVAAEGIIWCGACTECRKGNLNQCHKVELVGLSAPGAFAEYIAIKARYCWNLDPLREIFHSDNEIYEAGALIEPIGCAYNGMFVAAGGFKPGGYLVVYGSGPIGLAAVMLARAAGAAKIFAFDVSEPRNQLAMALGADYAASPAVLKRKGTSTSEVVLEMTDGYGADMQIEAAGAASATFPEIVKSFASNGKMVFLGRFDGNASIQFNTLVTQASQIAGARGHAGHGIYGNIIRLIAAGRLPVQKMITSRFAFENVINAIVQSAIRKDGKIIVHFSQTPPS